MKKKKPRVWFVDDLTSNLDAFRAAHEEAFDVTTFQTPTEVLAKLEREQPDALLCDIFFYQTPQLAATIERQVDVEVERIRKVGRDIGADDPKCTLGVELLQTIHKNFNGDPPFALYAYTSKGPYLLGQEAWDRIARSKARVLLKKRLSPAGEELTILRDIEEVERTHSWRAWIARHAEKVLISWGVGAIVLERVLSWAFGW